MQKDQSSNHILMIEPQEFFSNPQTAGSNHYQKDDDISRDQILKLAINEFRDFRDILVNHGVYITTFKGDRGCPDHIFPNWFTTFSDKTMQIFPMKAENRRLEKNQNMIDRLARSYAISADLSFHENDNTFLESTSSMVFDRVNDVAYIALSPRANKELAEQWCMDNNFEPIIFETTSHSGEPIYHTDVLMYVGTSLIGICLDVINEEYRELVEQKVCQHHEILKIEKDQLLSFCGNSLEVKNKEDHLYLVMSGTAKNALNDEQIQIIHRHYKGIISSDIRTIEKYGGGSARCMLSELF